MRRKLFVVVASLAILLLITVVAIPMHALFYLHFTQAGNTTHQLRELLGSLEWSREYEANEFDCSNMAARLCEELRDGGFRCTLAMDNQHVWVLVRTKEGVQNVEAIHLGTTLSSRAPLYIVHPSLSILVSPLAEFSYEEDELVEKPEPTPVPPAGGKQGKWELVDVGNDTLLRYKLFIGGILGIGGNSSENK